MICPEIDIHNPFVWALVAGFFLGAAAAEATIIPEKQRDPERARTWKWVWVYIFTACFFGSGAAGFFLSGPGGLLTRRVLFFGAASAAVCGAGVRFWKSVGIPLVMIVIALAVYLSLVLAPFACLRESVQVGWFRVLSESPEEVKAELNLGDETEFIELDTEAVRPSVAFIAVPQYFIFYGGNTYYRFISLGPEKTEGGEAEKELKPAERMAGWLPGIRFRRVKTEIFRPDLFQKYNITLHRDGAVELTAEY